MNYRQLGNTGIQVPEIGLGAWQLGNTHDWAMASDDEAVKIVHRALELGCNFFDTAPNYGMGKSEEILGKALKGKRDKVVINTKFGHHPDNVRDFDAQLIRPSIERSLKKLNTDYLDAVILHNPGMELLNGNAPQYEVFEKLVEEGKIRSYGASIDWKQEIDELLTTTNAGVIEILFNIFFQEPKLSFDLVKEKGVGVIVKVPLDSGFLTGKYNKESQFNGIRNRWSEDVILRRAELVDQIRSIEDEHNTMVQAALRFILGFDAVSTVIPGAKNIQQLEHNLSASDRKMDPQTFQMLNQFWDKNLKNNPLPW